jgi:hypothetical protein
MLPVHINQATTWCCFRNAAKLKYRDSKVINFSDLGLRDNVAQILVLENCSGYSWEHLCLRQLAQMCQVTVATVLASRLVLTTG